MAQNCYDGPHFQESCGCPPVKQHKDDIAIKNLDDVVKDYQKNHFDNLESFLRDLKGNIQDCVYGPFSKYKKHPHQWRIPNKILNEIVRDLQKKASDLNATTNFPELYTLVKETKKGGYGLLAIYDFAIRYGFSKGIEPEDVYLHAGTLEGAKAVLSEKMKIRQGNTIAVKEFPTPLQNLNGLHLENLLCIYKKELKRIKNG